MYMYFKYTAKRDTQTHIYFQKYMQVVFAKYSRTIPVKHLANCIFNECCFKPQITEEHKKAWQQ